MSAIDSQPAATRTEDPPGEPAERSPARRVPSWLPVLGLYLAVSLLTIGRGAVGDPTHVCACRGTADPATSMWALAWWPHALWHGLNPFITHDVWAPVGGNLAQSASIPSAALALAPVTELFGPLVAYNVLSIAAPALAAFTAYLLCRRIVGRELPAIAGGYLFGFSTYMLAQLTEHANLFLVFLIPVMVHLALRRASGELSRRAYVLVLAIVLALQVGLSTEVLVTAVLLGALTLAAACLLAPRGDRSSIARLAVETAGAGALALALASPFLYYALVVGGRPIASLGADYYGTDLLNPIIPTPVTALHGGAVFEGGHWAEADGYLSVPILLAFVAWAIHGRRRFLARLLSFAAALSLLASFGSHLAVNGKGARTLPYDWLTSWPPFGDILPSRLMMYATLAIAIGVADWLADTRGRRGWRGTAWRWGTVAVGALLLLPNLSTGWWSAAPHNPPFFTTAAYRRYLAPGESVLVLPYGQVDNSMLWQAETGFYFKMPEGYLADYTPPRFAALAATTQFESNQPVDLAALSTFVRTLHVRHIVIAAPGPYQAELQTLGLHAQSVGGVLVYSVPASAG